MPLMDPMMPALGLMSSEKDTLSQKPLETTVPVCEAANMADKLTKGDGAPDDTPTSTKSTDLDAPVPPHPLGVRPLGNKYLSQKTDRKLAAGTFQNLPDEVVMQVVEWLDVLSLTALGYTCKFLFAVCDYDELWKSLVLRTEGGQLSEWHRTWRDSLVAKVAKRQQCPRPTVTRFDCSGVFSDVLHRPFVCSHVPLARFARDIPQANAIQRLGSLTYEEFAKQWSNTPFILAEGAKDLDWPVMQSWSLDWLQRTHGKTPFRAESVDWPYALYDAYLQTTTDESPLYLFDRKFAEKMGVRVGSRPGQDKTDNESENKSENKAKDDYDYWKPSCFGPDFFEVLGSERPAHRWLIVGPAGSGSTFHKDPNATSAWNAVVQGAKYWILFPPQAAVPGVYVSRDQSEVTSPLSIAEWLLTFHAEARRKAGCIEAVCRAGEMVHVPSGWWHLVVNLEAGVALTQNFVSAAHLTDVLLFLRDRPEQVTGFGRAVVDPYGLFVERLGSGRGEREQQALAAALAEMARRDERRKRTWEAVVAGDDYASDETKRQRSDGAGTGGGGGGFTFGFGDLDDIE